MFWIDIENAAGVKQGPGPIVDGIRWRYRQRLSRAGQWSLEVPAGDPRLKEAKIGRYLHCWTMRNGQPTWCGGGPIEEQQLSLRGMAPPTLTISGADTLRELQHKTVRFEVTADDPPPLGARVLLQILAAAPGWNANIALPVPDMTARFVYESVLGALVATCEKMGSTFRLGADISPGRTIWIMTTPQHSNVLATNLADPLAIERNPNACLISNISHQKSGWEILNRAFVHGAGEGEARLNLAAATEWPNGTPLSVSDTYTVTDLQGRERTFQIDSSANTISDLTSQAEYGIREAALAYKDISPITNSGPDVAAAANALVLAAVNQLLDEGWESEQFSLSVAGLRAEVVPGQLIRVEARQYRDGERPIDIDTDLLVLETETVIDTSGEEIVSLTVSNSRRYPASDADLTVEALRQGRVMEAHPQMGPGWNTISYREDIDDSYGADFPFWFGPFITLVNSVILRFQLGPLRSTVKSVGVPISPKINIDPHTHTVNISPHVHAINPHQHNILLNEQSGGGIDNVNISHGGGGFSSLGYDGSSGARKVNISEQAGGTTAESGGGSSPTSEGGGGIVDFEIDLSNAIQTVYGIYSDPVAHYLYSDLTWSVNGTPVIEVPVGIGSGWFELDLTSYLHSPVTYRPLRDDNVIAVAVSNPQEKRVRVTAQIEIRPVIQSIAVV